MDGKVHRVTGAASGIGRATALEFAGQEIAAAVVWLCSDAASFVVGHAMVVDGGQTTGRFSLKRFSPALLEKGGAAVDPLTKWVCDA